MSIVDRSGVTVSDGANKNVLLSAQRVLHALRLICLATGPVPLAALAEQLGVSEVAAYRAAQTLVAAGYVRHAGGGRSGYEATWQVVELSAVLLNRSELRTVAAPLLVDVANRFNESVTLAIPQGDHILFIDRINGTRSIEFFCDIGRQLPLHVGAASRAILAHLPPAAFERYLAGDLRQFTDPQQSVAIDLRADRAWIRVNGYAFSVGDVEIGISGAAAAILGGNGEVLGAASIANVSARWTEQDISARGQAMADVCRAIGARCAPVATIRTAQGK